MRRVQLLAVATGAALLVASCSATDLVRLLSGQGSPGDLGQDPTTAPFSPDTSGTAPSDLPAGWTILPMPGEAIRWALPPTWTSTDIGQLRRDLQAMLDDASTPALYHHIVEVLIKSIDDGRMRLVILGAALGGTAASQVFLTIGPAVPDLEAAAAAMREISPILPESAMSGPEPVTLALGDGLRYEWVQGDDVAAGYVPAIHVAVVTRLPDSRSLWVEGSAPKVDAGWPDFVTLLADAVRAP
ncbi:MAG: hypothetical protein U0838_15460 [Chloroflexota bacterium]